MIVRGRLDPFGGTEKLQDRQREADLAGKAEVVSDSRFRDSRPRRRARDGSAWTLVPARGFRLAGSGSPVPGRGPPDRVAEVRRPRRYDATMTEYYDIDRANGLLPELRETILILRGLRAEVVALRDRIVRLNAPSAVAGVLAPAASSTARGEVEAETRVLRLRLQGMVDQMHAAVAQIDGWGLQLREIEAGLVDFPALVSGRPVWLCWRLEEDEIGWWHENSEGFESRHRLEDLV